MNNEIQERALDRERKRRKHAEHLLEEKSRELFTSYQNLESAHNELKKNQKQLLISSKMASLGVLSAGVAHEINNPVGFVLSNINSLGKSLPIYNSLFFKFTELLDIIEDDSKLSANRDELRKFLEDKDVAYLVEDSNDLINETKDGLNRIRTIVSSLKTFARADDEKFKLADINKTIINTLDIIKNQIKNKCTVTTDLQDLPQTLCNPGRLGQVFMNLITNASQAVNKNGKIIVRSYIHDEQIYVEVEDNGCGISDDEIDKLFTPFYTSKAVGEGTGLGLSISFGIVEDHGGEITVESCINEGTTFRVSIPIKLEAVN